MPDTPRNPEEQLDGPASPGGKDGPLPPARSEVDHFAICFICGQSFDLREMDQVLHHALAPHDPMPIDG